MVQSKIDKKNQLSQINTIETAVNRIGSVHSKASFLMCGTTIPFTIAAKKGKK